MKLSSPSPCALCLPLDAEALGRIMPLYLWIWGNGVIFGAGPTLQKLFHGQPAVGRGLSDVFVLQRPRDVASMDDLAARAGGRLRLSLRDAPFTSFKGMVVPLRCGQGILLNLSFGISVAEAVRDHRLTDADFAPTDLTVEMLYLLEAKTAVMEELHSLNVRLRAAKADAEEQALTDTLTGLHNRRAMDRALAGAAQTGRSFGLMHIDLDHFKEVNDTLGHAAGDHVLARVADILNDETRAVDTVARVGGDEFVLVLPGIATPEGMEAVARRILTRIEAPIPYKGRDCRVSASIGITCSGFYNHPEPDRILSDADRALYASKRGGRARITVFAPAPASSCAGRISGGGQG